MEKRVDLPDSWLTVLPLRLPQQAVVGDSLCVAAFQRVVGRRRLGHRALQVHGGGDGAGCLATVASFTDSPSVGLGATHLRLLSPLPLYLSPLHVLRPILAEGGKSPLDGAILVVGHVHCGGLDRQSDDIAGVLGRLGARRDRDAGHPAAVGVAEDATLVLAVEAFAGICEGTEKEKNAAVRFLQLTFFDVPLSYSYSHTGSIGFFLPRLLTDLTTPSPSRRNK